MDDRPLTWDDLLRYHHEVFMPDLDRVLRFDALEKRFDEMNAHFVEVCRRLDAVADNLHALNVWLDERNAIAAEPTRARRAIHCQ